MEIRNYYNAGYILIQSCPRPTHFISNVIPNEKIISASECLCNFYPSDLLCHSKKDLQVYKRSFNLSEDQFQVMYEWLSDKHKKKRVYFDGVFAHLDDARTFKERFLNHLPDINILGLNLPKESYSLFINPYSKNKNNKKPVEFGVLNQLKLKISPEPNGLVLGHEILGYEFGGFHSYLCNSLQDDFSKHFDFKVNTYGFIASLEESDTLAKYCNLNDLGEPVVWLSWLLIQY